MQSCWSIYPTKKSSTFDSFHQVESCTAKYSRCLKLPSKGEKSSRCYICIEQLQANLNQKSIFGIKLLCHNRIKYSKKLKFSVHIFERNVLDTCVWQIHVCFAKRKCPKHLVSKCEQRTWLFYYTLSYYDIWHSGSPFILCGHNLGIFTVWHFLIKA